MPGFICQERLAFGPWQAFERAIARLLSHAGFSGVSVVGGSGDLGADIVGIAASTPWLVQAKFRSGGAVGEDALREAVRAMSAYGAEIAVAATNQYFRDDASRRVDSLRASGIDARLWDGDALLRFFEQLPSESAGKRVLKHYQSTAVDRVEAARSAGRGAALVLMATGLGKSVVAGELIANELSRNPAGEVLLLAHTVDLVRQLETSLWPALPKEVPTHLWSEGESPSFIGGVTVATWQSVLPALQRSNLAGKYSMVVVDEAHHAASPVYRQLIDSLQPNFVIGLTATPWRGDSLSIADVFGEPVFAMDIVDGMQQGYLAGVDYRMITDDIDWSEVALLSRQGYTVAELNRKLLLPDRDSGVVATIIEHLKSIERPRALCFCRSIEHAERFRSLLLADGVHAAVIHSELGRDERFRNLSSFRRGSIQFLLSVDMLNEGIDVPDVNLVVFLRVTHSRRIFVQQLGRGLRVAEGKSSVRVLDFVADIRRIAAGLELNRQARLRRQDVEVLRFGDGRIVRFANDRPAAFFAEYLADVASIENLDESARLSFPT